MKNLDTLSPVVKDCVVTTVVCGLAVGAVSAVVGAIAAYFQELQALIAAFGAYLTAAFGPVALWLSQDIPSAVKWMLAGAFLWSFCISYNLNKKGVTGLFATVVNRTKNVIMFGFVLYWLIQIFIQVKPDQRFAIFCFVAFFSVIGYLLIREEEKDRLERQARQQSEQDTVQAQGAGQ
jgi:hypothetical protein